MNKKTVSIIAVLAIVLCFCTSCGKSSITGNWSVFFDNSKYSISIDEKGNIRKETEVIGSVSENSKTIILTNNGTNPTENNEELFQDFGIIITPEFDTKSLDHSAAAKTTDKYTFEELAYYFGVNANIKNTESPTNKKEYQDSILYNALLGNYIPHFTLDNQTKGDFFENNYGSTWLKETTLVLPELTGSYSNVNKNNNFYGNIFFVSPEKEVLTQQQIYNRQIEALNKALEINKTLREEGTLKDNMTDIAKAQVFAKYLKSLHMDPSRGGDCPPAENMYYDTAFSGLVQNVAACGGRAASYNLLLRTEGIACTAIGCTVNSNGGGHYINRMILDGKEYFYDWYNEPWFPKIMTKSEAEKVVTFSDGQYEYTGELIDQWVK